MPLVPPFEGLAGSPGFRYREPVDGRAATVRAAGRLS